MKNHGNITAEDALHHGEWVGRLARALSGGDGDAEDLAQEAWLAATADDDTRRGELGGWLTGVLRKLAAMRARTHTRRQRRERTVVSPDEPPTPEELMQRLQTQQLLARLVGELPEDERVVVLLRYFEGLSSAEIAKQLDTPAGTVRWRLKRAVDRLRERLDQQMCGERGRWMALLVPLAARSDGATTWLTGVAVMKAKMTVVAVLVACAACIGLWWSGSEAISASSRPIGAAEPRDRWDRMTTAAHAFGLPAWTAQAGVPGRRLSGRVLFDGLPVAGAAVRLESEPLPEGQAAEFRHTDVEGRFDFGQRPALRFSVGAVMTGRTGAVKAVDLRDPTVRANSLELHLGNCEARLWGRVLDSAGGPVVGASVRLAMGAGVLADQEGKYELCVLPGEQKLHVDASGYGALQLSAIVFGRTERDIVLTPEASIVGRVVRFGSGEPIAGALVAAEPGHFTGKDSVRGRATLSGTDGRFQLQVSPGEYSVAARLGSASSGSPVMVSTAVGRLGDAITLTLREGSVLRGVVRSVGKPIAGAKVTVFTLSGGERSVDGYSQSDGTFTIQGAPRGAVMFRAPPWAVVSPRRFVLEQLEQSVELEVAPQASLSGVVTLQASLSPEQASKPLPASSMPKLSATQRVTTS